MPLLGVLTSLEEGVLSMNVAANSSGIDRAHLEIAPFRTHYLDMHAGQKGGYHFGIRSGRDPNERRPDDLEHS